ncbi:D-alanyl-D-alanine-carboxypeptidase/endopeptidaseAmpH precursor [Serratia quinivorans]|uniref:D-alanyl-D-alanine- carboxypeptidase/endopeptidase AmpH n=1 Tax=Serratia TaxID=613 RepID=UPI00217AE2A7|nr:D-alanyl-D-alanine-carboxypeptidase/endopeptidase AmpH [Serratia quinivorans]CAI0972389.1 D-alanyl-D-alanine-carboxypeptidase/endopeptidaseAmpH precursor [Serratia quinivorans]CAI1059068.1 D-alanyl-D-alanine-carboxypeptidase/endopeptidaseAmpH precursor [Serratia quinivorans]CAI1214111.1 D-alanyl-D-alanine-carboxypeptidase/endopeptidaseAmpH precursor [Serratia quinivorans]CAI1775865.1 D-alanyl-D-alanine-carboxypeptidase/endopeptidaseAmpH precursor [Serratia quinivorans]CAI1806391.1 D-alanyl-
MKNSFSASLLALSLCAAPLAAQAAAPQLASQIVDQYAEHIFYNSGATGMALVVIDGNQVVNRSFGDTKPGNNLRPRPDSLIRIASITKLMTSEVMVKMAAEGQVKLNDPLRKYAPQGAYVPAYNARQPITLLNLATHTSALPREQPGKKPPKTPVFTWPTKAQRWQWLEHANVTVPPGVRASYSNLAYDLLADALSRAAGKPYTALLKEKITAPLGMVDTTLTPSAEQCSRLMVASAGPSACRDTTAAAGSGGVYSTPRDMQRWMQQFLTSNVSGSRKSTAASEQTMYFQRNDLVSLKGMDVPGEASALGLGWVYMAPNGELPGIIQKTGGGGGFITYMAMIPQKNVGVFVVVTRSELSKFTNMSDPVNRLVSDLAANKS